MDLLFTTDSSSSLSGSWRSRTVTFTVFKNTLWTKDSRCKSKQAGLQKPVCSVSAERKSRCFLTARVQLMHLFKRSFAWFNSGFISSLFCSTTAQKQGRRNLDFQRLSGCANFPHSTWSWFSGTNMWVAWYPNRNAQNTKVSMLVDA